MSCFGTLTLLYAMLHNIKRNQHKNDGNNEAMAIQRCVYCVCYSNGYATHGQANTHGLFEFILLNPIECVRKNNKATRSSMPPPMQTLPLLFHICLTPIFTTSKTLVPMKMKSLRLPEMPGHLLLLFIWMNTHTQIMHVFTIRNYYWRSPISIDNNFIYFIGCLQSQWH